MMGMKLVRQNFKAEDHEYALIMDALKEYGQKKERQGGAEALKAQGIVEALRGGLTLTIVSVAGSRLA